MEKLQLMMFEAIGYKLTFNPEVTKRYFNILQTRFGKNSEMEKHMNGLKQRLTVLYTATTGGILLIVILLFFLSSIHKNTECTA